MRTIGSSRRRVIGLLIGSLASGVGAQTPAPDVTVRTSLDRTAMWVADRVTYTIELACKRGVDILADDLSRDKLKTEGLDAIDGDTDRQSTADGATIYRFRYVLTTYRTDVAALTIAPLRVRYAVRRAGQRLEDASPAGEVLVPGAVAAFRSVLPDDLDLQGVRSGKPPHARPARFAMLQPIGIGLVIVAIVPGILVIASVVRLIRRPRVRRSVRAVRHDERASLDAVRQVNVDTIDGRRQVFTDLDALLRQHLRDVCGVAAASLTPHEVPFALASHRSNVNAELIASVLETCELARYAPSHAIPSADVCRETVGNVEQLIEAEGARGFRPGGRRSP